MVRKGDIYILNREQYSDEAVLKYGDFVTTGNARPGAVELFNVSHGYTCWKSDHNPKEFVLKSRKNGIVKVFLNRTGKSYE